jgi:hypothetical protein
MRSPIWFWFGVVGLLVAGAVIGVHAFDSMQTGWLKVLAGGFMGGACSLMLLIDRKPGWRLQTSIGCGALVFSALALLWYDTPNSSATLLLIALLVAAAIAWGIRRI